MYYILVFSLLIGLPVVCGSSSTGIGQAHFIFFRWAGLWRGGSDSKFLAGFCWDPIVAFDLVTGLFSAGNCWFELGTSTVWESSYPVVIWGSGLTSNFWRDLPLLERTLLVGGRTVLEPLNDILLLLKHWIASLYKIIWGFLSAKEA